VFKAVPPSKKLTAIPLTFAIFCLVSGGPYGLELVLKHAGITLGLILILVTPVLWGVPISLMTAELSSAIPVEGGYYVWVRRAMGPFAGFMCGWLSWLYSIVDAALYPLLFAEYASKSLEYFLKIQISSWQTGLIAMGLVLFVTFLNLRGIRAVGKAATVLALLILVPFVLLILKSGIHLPALPPADFSGSALSIGLATVLWNYLGWDNLSTVAGEVEEPQKSYRIALALATPLITLAYLLPVLSVLRVAKLSDRWEDGSWPQLATAAAGPIVGGLVLLGGLASATAMFVSQMLASSRIPAVLAEDGYLPRGLALLNPKTSVPMRSILFCAILYGALSWFSFSELITANAFLYGLSIMLEMLALMILRSREPELERPFKIPGGMPVLVLMLVLPMVLIGLLSFTTVREEGWLKQLPSVVAIFLGIVVYRVATTKQSRADSS